MNRNGFFCVSTSCFVSSRTTVVAVAAFLDAFQKVADLATNSRGKMGTRCSPYGDQSPGPGSRHTVRRIVLKASSEQSQVQLLVIVVKMSVRVLVVFLTVSISYLFGSLTFIIVAVWGL